jgi:hypothetical protein
LGPPNSREGFASVDAIGGFSLSTCTFVRRSAGGRRARSHSSLFPRRSDFGSSPPPAAVSAVGDAKQHFPFAIDPDPIFFEDCSKGESAQTPLLVRNTQASPLTLNRIETSCSCVGVRPVPIEIGPGESKALNVTFDSPSEPDFEGGLSVEITGYLSDGKVAFRTIAKLEIQPYGEHRDD